LNGRILRNAHRQAQVDRIAIRRGRNKLSTFVGTLGHIRFGFVWFAGDKKIATLIDALERFFDTIEGASQTILVNSIH